MTTDCAKPIATQPSASDPAANQDLVLSRTFDALRPQVYQVWTDPNHFSHIRRSGGLENEAEPALGIPHGRGTRPRGQSVRDHRRGQAKTLARLAEYLPKM